MRLAITGGTGFVGTNLIDLALARGHTIRALTRRTMTRRPGLAWVEGALDRPESLDRMMRDTDAVIHVAGVTTGTPEELRTGNLAGTEAVADAAARAGVTRFVHVSSLSAREPRLSAYGRSKCLSEEAVIASGGDWTIIRPPAIYGPGDKDLLELFRFARKGFVPLPPAGRLSLIAVEDLNRLLLACLDRPITHGHTFEPDDGRADGWSHTEFATAIGHAVGRRRILPVAMPARALRLAAWAGRHLPGPLSRLTADRAAYYTHPDWVVAAGARPPADLWTPAIETPEGLAATARWYRETGWLR